MGLGTVHLDSLSVGFTLKLSLSVRTTQRSWLRCTVQSSALRVQQLLPQVEVEEYRNQNDKNHSPLDHVRVRLVHLDLFVGVGVAQALCLVVHDLIDLLIQFLVVAVIAPHGQTPHDQPKTSSQNGHDHVQDVVRVLLLAGQYKQFFVHGSSLRQWLVVWVASASGLNLSQIQISENQI